MMGMSIMIMMVILRYDDDDNGDGDIIIYNFCSCAAWTLKIIMLSRLEWWVEKEIYLKVMITMNDDESDDDNKDYNKFHLKKMLPFIN